ncbi:MAG: hypothetical protein NC929_01585 [Candidatus Omnitrophica bacterium]|nr:hypothetical protein [Candidatus Omnitrophota bacterium]
MKMLDKLIKKVIEDAEKKAADIIREAKEELEERYAAEKNIIDKEYELKLQVEKEKMERENERKISAFVMDKEKELLALRNSFIDEVLKKVEDRFNEYLNRNMEEIIKSFCKEIKEDDYKVRIPADKDIHIDGVFKIERDDSIKNGFVIFSSKWEVVFNWESVEKSIEDILREKAGKFFLQNNGQTESP